MDRNRLSNQENPDDKQKRIQEDVQRRINAICDLASDIYDLCEPGMTITILLEEPPAIIAPNQKPSIKRLFITRPLMNLDIKR